MARRRSGSNGKTTNEKEDWPLADCLPPGTKVACVQTPTGHNTEIAIPASYLDGRQGRSWRAFRLNVAVDDFDKPGRGAQLWWRPDWRTARTRPGSGTFHRE